MSLLARASARYLLRHPAQLALALAGIALGVAVVVGVDLANDSARRAFEVSVDLVRGRSTHQLVGLDGTLPESLYPRLRARLGIHRAAPVIESRILLPDLPGRSYTLLGVDPLPELLVPAPGRQPCSARWAAFRRSLRCSRFRPSRRCSGRPRGEHPSGRA